MTACDSLIGAENTYIIIYMIVNTLQEYIALFNGTVIKLKVYYFSLLLNNFIDTPKIVLKMVNYLIVDILILKKLINSKLRGIIFSLVKHQARFICFHKAKQFYRLATMVFGGFLFDMSYL